MKNTKGLTQTEVTLFFSIVPRILPINPFSLSSKYSNLWLNFTDSNTWFPNYALACTQLCTINWRVLFSHSCMRSCITFYGVPSKDHAFSRSGTCLYCGMCSLFYLECKIVIRDSDWRFSECLKSMLKVIRGPIVHLWCHYQIYSKLDLHLDINWIQGRIQDFP